MANGLAIQSPPSNGNGRIAEEIDRLFPSGISRNPRLSPIADYETCRYDLRKSISENSIPMTEHERLMNERDAFWRLRERAQIDFLHSEHSKMLEKLHREVEKLQIRCTKLSSEMVSTNDPETIEMRRSSSQLEDELNRLKEQLDQLQHAKDADAMHMQQQLDSKTQQLNEQSDKIQMLSAELSRKTHIIESLSSKLQDQESQSSQASEKETSDFTTSYPPPVIISSSVTVRPALPRSHSEHQTLKSVKLQATSPSALAFIRRHEVRVEGGAKGWPPAHQEWRSGDALPTNQHPTATRSRSSSAATTTRFPPIIRHPHAVPSAVGNIEKPVNSANSSGFKSGAVRSSFRKTKEFWVEKRKSNEQ